ncbi:MAG: hypothetical protein J5712_00945, partial [Lachnospiraceae bacterium]|nr:hypothetical protein [Lachnospiraceae bacterium]
MKKRLSLILAVLMAAVILAGCSKSAAYDSAGNSFTSAPASQSAKTNSKADFGYASESYDM